MRADMQAVQTAPFEPRDAGAQSQAVKVDADFRTVLQALGAASSHIAGPPEESGAPPAKPKEGEPTKPESQTRQEVTLDLSHLDLEALWRVVKKWLSRGQPLRDPAGRTVRLRLLVGSQTVRELLQARLRALGVSFKNLRVEVSVQPEVKPMAASDALPDPKSVQTLADRETSARPSEAQAADQSTRQQTAEWKVLSPEDAKLAAEPIREGASLERPAPGVRPRSEREGGASESRPHSVLSSPSQAEADGDGASLPFDEQAGEGFQEPAARSAWLLRPGTAFSEVWSVPQVRSDAPAPATSLTPVLMDSLVERVAAALAASEGARATGASLAVEMELAVLGKVTVDVNKLHERLRLQIQVESPEARRWLQGHLQELHQRLTEQGLDVETLDLTFRGDQTAAREQDFEERLAPGASRAPAPFAGPERPPDAEAQFVRTFGYNTVEVWA